MKRGRKLRRLPDDLLRQLAAADSDELPDGAWWGVLEEAVARYNAGQGTDFNANEAVHAYLRWRKAQP